MLPAILVRTDYHGTIINYLPFAFLKLTRTHMSDGSYDVDGISYSCLAGAFFRKTHLGILTIFVANNVEYS